MSTLNRFDQVMERHSHRVYTLARYALGSPHDAEDVVQEVFTRLWENWNQIDIDRVEGWLIRVTSNACVDFCRRRSARKETKGSIALRRALDESPSAGTDPSTSVESSEMQLHVAAAIARLKDPYRAVLILREIEGLSYLEIGAALDIPMPSVKVTLHRARAKLTELLRPMGEAQHHSGQHREAGTRVL
jgi:RNA polymerase sigma-70 factor (ECF subfamily)